MIEMLLEEKQLLSEALESYQTINWSLLFVNI